MKIGELRFTVMGVQVELRDIEIEGDLIKIDADAAKALATAITQAVQELGETLSRSGIQR